MKTQPKSGKKMAALRITMFGVIILAAVIMLFVSNEAPVAADTDSKITLHVNDLLTVKPKNCKLSVMGIRPGSLKIVCTAPTATPTNTVTPTTTATATATATATNTLPPPQNENILSFISEQGDWIGGGQSKTYHASDATFGATLEENHRHIAISVTNESDWWYLDLAAPEGAELAVGAYEGATRYPFQAAAEPGLSFYGNGSGCNTLTGRFDILEANYSGTEINRFHAKFEQHCEGGAAALFGEIQIVKPPTSAERREDRAPAAQVTRIESVPSLSGSPEGHKSGEAAIKRKLRGGQKLNVAASKAPGAACQLEVQVNTPKLVKVSCKPINTPMPTRTKPAPPKGPDGNWSGKSNMNLPLSFRVAGNKTTFNSFVALVDFPACVVRLTLGASRPIVDNGINFHLDTNGGTVDYRSTFTSDTTIDGTFEWHDVSVSNCGTGSPSGTWSATWVGAVPPNAPGENSSGAEGEWQITVVTK